MHLPLGALAAGAGLPASARVRPLVVIRRSQEAAALLRARDPDVVGGMQARAGAGRPVVGPAGAGGTVA
ncbi:hypothetical protein ACQ4WX_07395 [Streptomyces lasalocidi]